MMETFDNEQIDINKIADNMDAIINSDFVNDLNAENKEIIVDGGAEVPVAAEVQVGGPVEVSVPEEKVEVPLQVPLVVPPVMPLVVPPLGTIVKTIFDTTKSAAESNLSSIVSKLYSNITLLVLNNGNQEKTK